MRNLLLRPLGVNSSKKELRLEHRIKVGKKQDFFLMKQHKKTSSLITPKGHKNI